MSYLLEALKKKESENDSSIPDLQSQHYHADFEQDSFNYWKLAVVILSVIVLAIIGYFIYNATQQDSNAIENIAQIPTSSRQPTLANQELPNSQINSNKTTIEVANTSAVSSSNGLTVETKPIQLKKPVVTKIEKRTVKNSKTEVINQRSKVTDTAKNTTAKSRPVIDPLTIEKQNYSNLPALRYSSHVYADKPDDRFVMLNGKALGIGEKLSNGVRVIDILEDSLLIAYQGKQYEIASLADVNQK
ncbi:general secretion pathway protein GspB [Kangiella sp. HZ709]|uniref:general secretion pathway protein GspB n=1 Tax=Kangiella sp. HZ709 TaxID=2666328 RepID=UPI0012AF1067|nr:general secretion pathway protein GspB [Kangiella sp. HZ709]MRX28650.1 hypothetical protein [Kangiella sp. HZ709]